jgi:hypothetical protein
MPPHPLLRDGAQRLQERLDQRMAAPRGDERIDVARGRRAADRP